MSVEAIARLQSTIDKTAIKLEELQKFRFISLVGKTLVRNSFPHSKGEFTLDDIDGYGGILSSVVLVFTHSLLEDLVADLLRFSCAVKPDSWTDNIKDRTIKLTDLKGRGYEQCREDLLRKYVNELTRSKSLAVRIGILMSACKKTAIRGAMQATGGGAYQYDRHRIERIDQHRQKIVHQVVFPEKDDDSRADILYLGQTMMFLAKALDLTHPES